MRNSREGIHLSEEFRTAKEKQEKNRANVSHGRSSTRPWHKEEYTVSETSWAEAHSPGRSTKKLNRTFSFSAKNAKIKNEVNIRTETN